MNDDYHFFFAVMQTKILQKTPLPFLDYIASVTAKVKEQQYHRGNSSITCYFLWLFPKDENTRENSLRTSDLASLFANSLPQ